jgi:hypothetical protein
MTIRLKAESRACLLDSTQPGSLAHDVLAGAPVISRPGDPPGASGRSRGRAHHVGLYNVARTAISALGLYDPEAEENAPEAVLSKAIRLTAQVPTLVAAIGRLSNGKEPLEPKPGLGLAANFLYMLNGEEPTKVAADTLDIVRFLPGPRCHAPFA